MQNDFIFKVSDIFIKKLNVINLITLLIFLVYFFSITLAPIVNSIINTQHNNLFFAKQNRNLNSYKQILKFKTTNNVSAINTVTYINNGQMLARQIDDSNLQNYVNDAKGSVLKLNSADKSQNQTYSYDAYNKPITNTIKSNFTLNVVNSFQYNGERFDNNTALQYLRARFYNSETGRFISQDTYNLLNRFNYTNSNPVMRVDSSGHDINNFDPFNSAVLSFICSTFAFLIVNFSHGIVRDVAIKITSKTKFFIKSTKATIISVTEPITATVLCKIYEYKNYSENKEAEITLYKDRCDSCEKLRKLILEKKSKIPAAEQRADCFKWRCQAKQFLQEKDLGEMSIAHIEKERKRIEDLNEQLATRNDMLDDMLRAKQ